MDAPTLLTGATILLVDDNPANLGVLTQLLTAHGWRVLVAQQGEIGLQIAQRVQPDLILMDVMLPGMDGFEACRRLKADAGSAEIPVLFMTVRMEAADKLKGFQAGAVDYITKPFQAEEVLARVTTHLRLRQLTHSLQAQNAQLQQEIVERRQAEQALQRAHVALEQQVAERTAALSKTEALYYISHSLITIEQLPDLLQAVVDKIVEALPADRVMLTLFDFEKRLLSYYVKGGPGVEHLLDVSFEGLWAGLVGWAMRELKPALSPKGAPDPRESSHVQQRRAETDCGAIIVAPLRYREKTLGTITAINRPDQPDFTQADVDLMMTMANQAAMTIENTQLLLSLRKAHAELEQRVRERTAALIQANADLQAQIAERQRIEAELLTERNLLRTLINNVPDQIYVKDTAGRFVLANSATMQRLNVSAPDDLLGKTDVDFFAPEQAAQYRADELAVLQSGWPLINKEESGIDKQTDSAVWILTTKVPVRDAHGQIIGMVGINRDITARKRLEAQFLQAQKMEGIGRLAGGVAHDFNNLLTAIIGYAELARDELDPSDSLHSDLQAILEAANRATTLTHQLLVFARKQVLEPQVLQLNELVLNLDKLLRRLIGEDIELVALIAPDLWLVKADANQIEQVLLNLAINARDAMPQGGKLTIETVNVDLDAAYAHQHMGVTAGPYVMLAVSDTGVGMSLEVQAQVFEPFFTTKEAGKGTGLGLATCYGIVKQHSGHISIYSEVAHGTTFKVYLPRTTEVDDPRLTDALPETMLAGSETVLLVEDALAVRQLAARVLRQLGYAVLEANDGVEALRVAGEHLGEIDLLLTDVVLPQLGGTVLAERLRGTYPRLKVLFMSGYTDQTVVHHSLLEPGVAFLQKPFAPVVLARKVREVLATEEGHST